MKKVNLILVVTLMFTHTAMTWAGGGSTVGVGNPAGALCAKKGGTNTAVKDAEGNESALCTLGRAMIGDWTFFRQVNGQPQLAVTKFLTHASFESPQVGNGASMANPASLYCNQVGGVLRILNTPAGQLGVCEFADNSSIEEWTLFYGPQAKTNAKLVRVLK